jgi:cell division protein FtsL
MIFVFVLVATIVISRYAAVYELNLRTSQLAADIEQLKMENNELKFKVSQLSDPQSILKDAEAIGMKPIDVKEIEKIGFSTEETKTVVVNQP